MFDIDTNNLEEIFDGDIDLPEDWSIGLIVGASGTGKTTIAKELFPKAYFDGFKYSHDSLLDDFPSSMTIKSIIDLLSSVGLSSAPTWLKPYKVLSNGEKMRCDLAMVIANDKELVVFDEFTSVVDRQIAKVGSFALQKSIRRNKSSKKRFIAVSCHYDIEDWLLPDWVFDTNSMTFRLCGGQKKNRPKCEFSIYEVKEKNYYWSLFKKYHYLSHSHNNAARTFVCTLNGELCGFLSLLHFMHPKKKNTYQVHRWVVRPDYQGIGIGSILINEVASYFSSVGKTVIITTSNPSAMKCLAKSNLWRTTRIGRVSSGSGLIHNKKRIEAFSRNRNTASFEFLKNNAERT